MKLNAAEQLTNASRGKATTGFEMRSTSLTKRSTKPSFGWPACPPGSRLRSQILRPCHQGSTEEEAEDLGTWDHLVHRSAVAIQLWSFPPRFFSDLTLLP